MGTYSDHSFDRNHEAYYEDLEPSDIEEMYRLPEDETVKRWTPIADAHCGLMEVREDGLYVQYHEYEKLNKKLEFFESVLKVISEQNLEGENLDWDWEDGDFEGAYVGLVSLCRKTLEKNK